MWKDIEGYEGLYMVSSIGEIKSLEKLSFNSHGSFVRKEKIRKYGNAGKYKIVTLSKDGVRKSFYVARLVAKAFIPNQNNYEVVMHMDNNPSNNDVSNLKWGTYSDNNSYAYQCGNQEYVRKHNSERFKTLHKNKDKIFKNYA